MNKLNNLKRTLKKTYQHLCIGTFAVIFVGNTYSASRIVNQTNSNILDKFESFVDFLPIVIGKSLVYSVISPAFIPYALGKWLTSEKIMVPRKININALPDSINQNGLWPHVIPDYEEYYKVKEHVRHDPKTACLYDD